MVVRYTRKHVKYIQLTAALSLVSFAIVCTSMGTQQWIRATAKPTIEGPLTSEINYGLFGGTLVRRLVFNPYEFDLYITCVWGENACAWSCASSKDLREAEVEDLVEGKTPIFSCLSAKSMADIAALNPRVSEGSNNERIFTNAGLWLSTIIFIVILMITLVASFVLSIINCLKSPIEMYFNVQGIYLTNAVALLANFLVLLLYGICYDSYIKENISIYDTIVGDYTSEASLGYSYWILHLPLLLQVAGIILIVRRERILNSDRAETKIDIAHESPASGVLF